MKAKKNYCLGKYVRAQHSTFLILLLQDCIVIFFLCSFNHDYFYPNHSGHQVSFAAYSRLTC